MPGMKPQATLHRAGTRRHTKREKEPASQSRPSVERKRYQTDGRILWSNVPAVKRLLRRGSASRRLPFSRSGDEGRGASPPATGGRARRGAPSQNVPRA